MFLGLVGGGLACGSAGLSPLARRHHRMTSRAIIRQEAEVNGELVAGGRASAVRTGSYSGQSSWECAGANFNMQQHDDPALRHS